MKELEEKRKKLNLSQEQVAVEVGISRQYYNSIENDKRKPSIVLAKRLGNLFKVEWTIFFK